MEKLVAAPRPAHRLVPSRFPPIGLFDTVATAADAAAVMELAGWTNDRLVAERIDRLPRDQWVYGRANASIVMASFLHVAPGGMRFSGPDLGAWYAAASIITAAAEVGHHLRREAVARSVKGMRRTYRNYTSVLIGDYRDIRGRQHVLPDAYASNRYEAAQAFGEGVRTSGASGLVYDSLRHRGGCNIVAYRPVAVTEVVQAEHFEISVEATSRRIEVHKLSA
ncbi:MULTISPECIES: RES family NAD+ phosphorylase [Brevundimonas]|uniref:RES family NAD+ phosphorylase n=1 Tax=Brevundimonas TaxID=41275 RepID=UPI001908FC16|nr:MULTISPECIES: RES family NAD+ phosphorylase [Brevundimonas]MBK1967812.1 RES family NAD+ phosphorylase [Brevundimonas diminuta]MBK1977033.1 RES family NAD+ phosphorylase [Brevundimonas diminuta]